MIHLLSLRQNKEKTAYLRWFDILVLTLILWGRSIYVSTTSYIGLVQGTTTIYNNFYYTVQDNYSAMARQAVLLLLALLYLWLRGFDFKTWTIRFRPKAVLYGGLIFLGVSVLFYFYWRLTGPLTDVLPFPGPIGAFFGNRTVSDVIFAMFNGTYEELYFLGICLAVREEHLKWAVPFSLLIRISFHTYQGMISALGIGLLLGGVMYLLYRRSKDKNLLPFFIAHALADIFRLHIIWYILIYLRVWF